MSRCLIFSTTRQAIRSEKILLEQNIRIKIIPVPKNISAECGIAIELNGPESDEYITELLKTNNIKAELKSLPDTPQS
jgi:hypothetical protein